MYLIMKENTKINNMERIINHSICFIAGSALTLSLVGSTLLIGVIGGIGGILGKYFCEWLIKKIKHEKTI